MRKIVCLFIALVLCLSIAAPALATESGFVPSITYKPSPEIVPIEGENGEEAFAVIRDKNGEVVDYAEHSCFRITPIAHVWDPEIEVPDYIENLLLLVYNGLNDNSLAIPYEELDENLPAANMAIRDLFDIRWYCEEHDLMLKEEGNTVEIIFDLGVVADAEIFVATFDEDNKDWNAIVKTVNNGDGTVTCTFEHFCVASFSMPMSGSNAPTDVAPSVNILPWIIILLLAILGVVIVLVVKNKKKAEG